MLPQPLLVELALVKDPNPIQNPFHLMFKAEEASSAFLPDITIGHLPEPLFRDDSIVIVSNGCIGLKASKSDYQAAPKPGQNTI